MAEPSSVRAIVGQLAAHAVLGIHCLVRLLAPPIRRTGCWLKSFGRASVAWLWLRRCRVVDVVGRLTWWTSLLILWVHGRAFMDGTRSTGPMAELLWFMGGAALATGVLAFTLQRRLRLAGWVLALAHGTMALLVAATLHGS